MSAAHAPSKRRRWIAAAFATAAFALFIALGVWQLYRLQWKLDLISRVDARVHAAAVDAPAHAQWPRVNRTDDEYRHIRIEGTFLPGHDTLVQATTDLGMGYWLLTPLRRDDGTIVIVNRGFVPTQWRAHPGAVPPAGAVEVSGLLRISEPGGAFLRHNDPDAQRWYSRDVDAIATKLQLADVAPYFIDANAKPSTSADGYPVAGITVVSFYNHHLGYALTWFGLALLVALGAWRAARNERIRT